MSLKEYRKNVLRLSQAGLAQRLGTSQISISHWETGKVSPSLAQFKNMVDTFPDVSAYEILEWFVQGE